jgi:hypothetical protein
MALFLFEICGNSFRERQVIQVKKLIGWLDVPNGLLLQHNKLIPIEQARFVE